MTTLYLAGTMSWQRQFNFPEFRAVTLILRYYGLEVISPVESDSPDVQTAAWNSPDGDPNGLPESVGGADPKGTALKNMDDIWEADAVALLDGWGRSEGTLHELATAKRWQKPSAPWWLWAAAADRTGLTLEQWQQIATELTKCTEETAEAVLRDVFLITYDRGDNG